MVCTGINDILGSLFELVAGTSTSLNANMANIAPCHATAIKALLANGEKNIIVGTASPAYTTPLANSFGIADLLRGYIPMVNTALKEMVVSLSADNPAANIIVWDTFSVFSQLLKDHDKYGVTDITHPCLVKQVGFSDPLGFGNNKLISRCLDPSKFAFW